MTSPDFIAHIRTSIGRYRPLDFFRSRYHVLGYEFRHEAWRPNIFGIRNPDTNVAQDSFNDTIGLIMVDDQSNVTFRLWEATTDPGLTHLQKPTFPEAVRNGTAIMAEGQYVNAYEIGNHGSGRYAHIALRQVGSIRIFRDRNKDAVLDMVPSLITEGHYGINIHQADVFKDPQTVGLWSAGCQVFAKRNQFSTFMNYVKLARTKGWRLFDYTLFTLDQFKGA